MALKDIFTMIKADRYTADGCEEIKKAQKAIAEDAGLPDGTIRHRKDGDYVKQGGKWKPAPAGKAPGAKTGPGKSPNETINAKRAQQKESEKADYNRNIRSFHENTGLNGGPEEVLARKEAEKADRKQDNLQPGKRDDSMFKAKDKVEFARHGKYMNGEIESIRKDWKGNVQMQVKGEDGQSYFVEAGDITKHSSLESKPAETPKASWNDAKVGLSNQAGVPLSLNAITFGMTPAWAEKHGYSKDDVNGTAAEVKLAKQIITNQDWSNPEDAVKKINDMGFGYTNWKVTESQGDKVKIASKDSLGNTRELTIKKPQSAPATSTETKSTDAPKSKSRNTLMLEKKGFKEVEKGGSHPKLPRFQYESKSGKTYNVYRDIDGDGYFYHVQTPGGFTKTMRDVGEIKKYLDSDGGNWGHAPDPRGLLRRPYTEKDLIKSNKDAAPRELTGDCKIRIRKR